MRVRMRFQFAKAASSRDTHSAAPIECLVEKSDSETAVPQSSAEPAGGARDGFKCAGAFGGCLSLSG